ncbi:MAG TPA: multiheme c-type cytochrome, partial [Verrucomicrobiota bacterium]|nr:multiheme c-type cytochrome [Verrucomicrobiota bacterium]
MVSLISQNNIAADNEKENSVSTQEQKKPKTKYPGPPADNSRCLVCHANFEDEKLTAAHLKANVGCIVCHLECDSHCVDEDNLTPPDRMFANKG